MGRKKKTLGMTYRVYTDGACANNQAPGGQPGGWACLFEGGSAYSGAEPHTTNNRMEMTAVIEALQHTPKGACVSVYSDSAYVINAFKQNWFGGWEKRGWRLKANQWKTKICGVVCWLWYRSERSTGTKSRAIAGIH